MSGSMDIHKIPTQLEEMPHTCTHDKKEVITTFPVTAQTC